ncbi:MAG: PfkB family carbohydrate kinase [Oceanipulchritudo sp.]
MKLKPVLCFGEIVWDALPAGIFLGGAPLNVAYHLNCLGRPGLPVSRVGDDFLGEETLRRLHGKGVSDELIQTDDDLPTGAVVVDLDPAGDARYDIREPAAWDAIEATEKLLHAGGKAAALVYGSLALRKDVNRVALSALLEAAPVRLCDVNLRAPFDDRERVLEWAAKATHVKLNGEELDRLSPVSTGEGLEKALAALAETTGVGHFILTRGGEGAHVWKEGRFLSAPVPEVEVADTVGAGDAFTAAYLDAFLKGEEASDCLERAVELGAYVAGRNGAQPDYDKKAPAKP